MAAVYDREAIVIYFLHRGVLSRTITRERRWRIVGDNPSLVSFSFMSCLRICDSLSFSLQEKNSFILQMSHPLITSANLFDFVCLLVKWHSQLRQNFWRSIYLRYRYLYRENQIVWLWYKQLRLKIYLETFSVLRQDSRIHCCRFDFFEHECHHLLESFVVAHTSDGRSLGDRCASFYEVPL